MRSIPTPVGRVAAPGAALAVLAVLGVLAVLAGGCTGETRPDGSAVPRTQDGSEPAVSGMPVWQRRTSMGMPRDDFAHVVVGDEIWTFGGMTGDRGTRLDTSEVYDTSTDSWRYGPDLPQGLCSFEGAAIGPRIYLFGGLDAASEPTDFAAVLDTRTGEWQQLPPLPHARYAHDVEELGGRIYVIGGEDSAGAKAAVDVFDPKDGSWSQAAPMPRARSSIDLVPVGDVMYVLGGWLGSSETDLVQTYDTSTDTWDRAPSMPRAISRGGAAGVDGKIYVSYHEWSAVYDVRRGRWSPANPMTVSRHGFGY
ncbi:MAG: hypothetical protein M3211_05655, partial [Actinomycetota bacterium]|nr:hypothetical protein [Actinomycetota bacterium]